MKVAVCITGRLNLLPYTYLNIQKNVIEQLGDDVDIFVYSSTKVTKGIQKSVEEEDEINEKYINNYLKCTKICLTPDITLSTKYNFKLQNFGVGIEKYLQMNYSLLKCNEMIKNYSKENNFEYDFIVRLRVDTMFIKKIPYITNYSKNTITMPEFHNERGGKPPLNKKDWYVNGKLIKDIDGRSIHDRFAIGPPKLMNFILDILNILPENDDKLKSYVYCEHLLNNYLRWNGLSWENGNIIRNDDILFFRIRVNEDKQPYIFLTDFGISRNHLDKQYSINIEKYYPNWKNMKLEDFV